MSGPTDPRQPVSSGTGAPPPRRGGDGAPAAAEPLPSAPTSSSSSGRRPTVVEPGDAGAPTGGRQRRDRREDADATAKAPKRARAPWWLRIVAWVVAVPLGLVLVGVPARKLGYLDSQKLLDVLIGKDTSRYVPLVVIVVLWALVTALLVQLIIEGGGRLLRRRHRGRAAAA